MAVLGDYISVKHGYAFKGDFISIANNGIVLVTPGNFAIGGGFKENKCKYFTGDYTEEYVLKPNDLIVTMTDLSKNGDTLGYGALVPDTSRIYLHNQRIGLVQIESDEISKDYLYWFMRTRKYQKKIVTTASGSTVKHTSPSRICEIEIELPSLKEQNKIASVLNNIENKIYENSAINNNLFQQAQTIYREMFVNATNDQRQTCRAEEYFDIAIGKTPPRKEHQWFTTDPSDVTWVSISDMGSCGTYIRKSSEQLTQEAVDKFNIRVIPSNTVLLSFKLTVGRIAITYGEMTTNEAIAHFKTDKAFINEYLYCYLKDFNYQTMGSTSSIATAVNSKIIKAMPFVIPTDDEISRFHTVVSPIFEQILNNQLENDSLAEMRDALLPRLMFGELDVSDIDF